MSECQHLQKKETKCSWAHQTLFFPPAEIFDLTLAGWEEKDRADTTDGSTFPRQNVLSTDAKWCFILKQIEISLRFYDLLIVVLYVILSKLSNLGE